MLEFAEVGFEFFAGFAEEFFLEVERCVFHLDFLVFQAHLAVGIFQIFDRYAQEVDGHFLVFLDAADFVILLLKLPVKEFEVAGQSHALLFREAKCGYSLFKFCECGQHGK